MPFKYFTVSDLAGHVAVRCLDAIALFIQPFANLLGNHHGAVLAACAAESDG
jgi:hypothetical protein